jgi:2-keto-4-pentenoate hydratase/2-oxohepta-3-ene-1,7-dioic acid hydratase in catechol pathway
MRLVTYRRADATLRAGAVLGSGPGARVVDLADATHGRLPTALTDLIGLGGAALELVRGLDDGVASVALEDVALAAPIPRPPKLIAAAGNYQAHIVEGGLPPVDKERIVPKLFIKPSTTIAGPGDTVALPSISTAIDWELELAIVIGRGGKDISIDRALDHVFGYTVINDISARRMDWGVEDRQPGGMDGFFDWLNGKWPDGFAPMGPWIVTQDEIADPDALKLRLEVNGAVRQDASTAEMIFSCPELIAFASRIMTLEPGDVIATGTPQGVGDTTGEYLADGDVMSGWIEGIGTLATTMAASATADA